MSNLTKLAQRAAGQNSAGKTPLQDTYFSGATARETSVVQWGLSLDSFAHESFWQVENKDYVYTRTKYDPGEGALILKQIHPFASRLQEHLFVK